jgi:hypothetical protein
MYIRLVDKHNWKSPVLYIHADEKEWIEQIILWRKNLLAWCKKHPIMNGMPLGRLEASVCMVDLIRHLSEYYVNYNNELAELMPDSITEKYEGHIVSTFRLLGPPEADGLEDVENIIEIKTYEDDNELWNTNS